jgi:cellulose synthase operon protein C
VTAENPLRYGLPSIPRSDAPASFALPQASISPLIQEPPLATPLVARRVIGVGPMPYERYGFTLLPGWNGKSAATWPPYSAQSAAAGTLWNDDVKTFVPAIAAQPSSIQAPQSSPTSAQNYWNR